MASGGEESSGSAQEREREAHALGEKGEREADELERRSEELEGEIGEVREDWERKRADASVPGAPPPDGRSGAQPDRSRGPEPPPEDQ